MTYIENNTSILVDDCPAVSQNLLKNAGISGDDSVMQLLYQQVSKL